MCEFQDIGPQYKGDTSFRARMRFHQSWYRAHILKLPYGVGPNENSRKKYGNMLTREDGDQGRNFFTPEIFISAQKRAAENVGTLDKFRLFCNMLSSMPMCFNLFVPLQDDLVLATRLLGSLFPDQVAEVLEVRFEFSPTPKNEFLNDRTAFDVFIDFLGLSGDREFMGIEVKLTEPFSTKGYENLKYDYLTSRHGSPWKPGSQNLLVKKDINQLWRNHLLVQAMLNVQADKYKKAFFVTIYHQDDADCCHSLQKYFSLLNENHNAHQFSLEMIRNKWEPLLQGSQYETWFRDFCLRYLDLETSEK